MTEYIAILPDAVDPSEHAYLRLQHPRTATPQLYLPTPTGLCEVAKVGGAHGRTWFVGDKVSQGAMLVHQPIDPVFLAIPLVLSLLHPDRPAQFQPLPDLFSTITTSPAWHIQPAFSPSAAAAWNPDLPRLLAHKPFRRAFRACCERKVIPAANTPPGEPEAKPTAYYRPSRDAALALLRTKVDRLARAETFALFDHLVRGLGREGLLESGTDAALVQAARTAAAIDHIAAYLPQAVLAALTGTYDLTAYKAYLADRVAAAKAAEAPIVNEKKEKGTKRKLAKTESSRGVEALKKVNTNGMAKMTSFFKPKAK